MNKLQFTQACKAKGVNIKMVKTNKKSVTISYNYTLPANRLSETHTSSFFHTCDDRLQAIFNEHFANADQLVRF
jgi:phenylalanyl-tRNA synthetase beta subunit